MYDTFLVATLSPGYWGRGSTIKEAIQNAQWINGGDRVHIFKCGPRDWVSEMGNLICENEHVHIGIATVKAKRDGVHKIQLRGES